MRRKTDFRGRRSGFTMIEMAIVLIIIGILAAIAIPRLSTSGESAYIAAMKSDITNAITAMTNYYAETGEYADVSVDGSNSATKKKINENKSNIEIAVSKGNRIAARQIQCNDGSRGYEIGIASVNTNKRILYNSCTDANIHIETVNRGEK